MLIWNYLQNLKLFLKFLTASPHILIKPEMYVVKLKYLGSLTRNVHM